MRSGEQDSHGEAGPSRRLVLISLITSVTLVGMVLVLAWGRATHNNDAANYEASSLVAAATHELRAQTRDLRDLVDKIAAGETIRTERRNPFDRIFVVDPAGNRAIEAGDRFDRAADYPAYAAQTAPLVTAAEIPARAGLRGQIYAAEDSAETSIGSASDGLFVVTGEGAFAASLVPVRSTRK